MSDMALNRRAAELGGWRVVRSATSGAVWQLFDPGGALIHEIIAPNEEIARARAVEYYPNVSGDPAATIKLLEDVSWDVSHKPARNSLVKDGTISRYLVRVGGYVGRADSFAEAACEAWCEWREAGE
jgi:hypothetical protein